MGFRLCSYLPKIALFACLFTACLLININCGLPTYAAERVDTSEDTLDANRPIKDKWAVIIGISKFQDPLIPTLQYPAKDAQDLYNFLVGKGHFARDHVLLLTDKQATRVAIVDAFGDGWLPRRVMKDDLVLIFISTHGSPADVAGENFIIAYDSDPSHPYATGIRFQDLAGEVTKRTGCDRLVLLLDACHSGAAVTGGKSLLREHSNFNLETIAGTGQLVISSSQPDQVSWESKRYPNGVFTYNLIKALDEYGEKPMVAEAFKHLKEGVEQEVRFDRVVSQTPMLLSKWKGGEPALCAPPSEPRQVLPEIPRPSRRSSPTTPPAATGSLVSTPATLASASRLPCVPAEALQPSSAQTGGISATQASPSAIAPPPPVTSPTGAAGTGANCLPTVRAASSAGSRSRSGQPMMTTSWVSNGGDATLESGTRLLQSDELKGLRPNDLLYLYNEAYARHGRGFLSGNIQQHFNAQPWYRIDPDYHFRPDDARVISSGGQPDDGLIINAKRTPRQWANMQLIKKVMKSCR